MKFILFLCLAAIQTSSVSAATVTLGFDEGDGPGRFEEDGYSYDYDTVYNDGSQILLTDDSGLESTLIESTTGSRFDAVAVDLFGFTKLFRTGSHPYDPKVEEFEDWAMTDDIAYHNLSISGLRDGERVAYHTSNVEGPYTTTLFDSSFSNLDQLIFALQVPAPAFFTFDVPDLTNFLWCDEWCSDVGIDNLTLRAASDVDVAPVPLPASLWLLTFAFAGLAGIGRVYRFKSAA